MPLTNKKRKKRYVYRNIETIFLVDITNKTQYMISYTFLKSVNKQERYRQLFLKNINFFTSTIYRIEKYKLLIMIKLAPIVHLALD